MVSRADLVIANTAVAVSWINQLLMIYPHAAQKVIWWIHEIDTPYFLKNIDRLDNVAALIFDSNASLKQWQSTGLIFPSLARVVHLSVCDDFCRQTENSCFPFPINKYSRMLGFKPPLCDREEIREKLKLGSGLTFGHSWCAMI